MPVADGALGPLVTPDRLREFFAPRSIAMVGASDTSGWSRFVVASSLVAGFSGPLIPVHPVHETVSGQPAVRSLRDLTGPVDLAFIMAPVPGELVDSADAAAAAARRLGLPAALKVCSAQIAHKSEIGGVALGLSTEAEVRAAYARVSAAGRAVPGARIDGVLVSPMRTGGVELIAGVTVDPTFGPVLAVGLGGVWVEVLKNTSLRVLPVDPREVRQMLGELRGSPLLLGARGSRPANVDVLAEVITGLGDAAVRLSGTGARLNGALRALEVNPLWVDGDRVEALDVLVVTGSESPAGTGPPTRALAEEPTTRAVAGESVTPGAL
jgi:predicted CoA-binding protein